jgi:hypothetical protein
MKKHRLKSRKSKAIHVAEAALLRAIEGADARGFTGYTHGKGGLFDDPIVKRCKKRYEKLIA